MLSRSRGAMPVLRLLDSPACRTSIAPDVWNARAYTPGRRDARWPARRVLPSTRVQHWFSRQIAPAPRAPSRQKLRYPAPDVLRIGKHSDHAWPRQCRNPANTHRQFPLIMRRERGIAVQYAFPHAALENACPAARTRIAEARPIGGGLTAFIRISSNHSVVHLDRG